MKKFMKIVSIVVGVFVFLLIGGSVYFNSTFPKEVPVSNLKVELTPERIERGKYLANNVAMCIDCHSSRDFSKFSGPVKEGTEGMGGEIFGKEMGLPGTIPVRNITPAAIGDWTDGEILRALTSGINKHGEALFPIMPYDGFAEMDQEDLYSIIAYLRTLKPIDNEIGERNLDFPVNYIVKTLPLNTYKPRQAPDRSNTKEYGKYLVKMASCHHCHSQSNEGEPVAGMEFAGGTEIHLPFGIIRSANLTPDVETGLGAWTKEQFIQRFKLMATDEMKNIPVEQGSFNTIMPWSMYGGMTDEDLGAIYDYLHSLKPVKNQVVKFTPAN
ncbi:MAG: c-type cytochrome [Ignavibacteriales bacterium]|nr:MAG: c-type cytochrome [Ignavibacteriales bacterium]